MTALQYPAYNMPIGNRFNTDSYNTPTIIDRTCDINNPDNRFMVYVEPTKNDFSEHFFAGIHASVKSMRPDMKIYVLVGVKPDSNLKNLMNSAFIQGFLINPPETDMIKQKLPIDFLIKA